MIDVGPERIVVLVWPNGAMSVEDYDQDVGKDLQTRRPGVVRVEYRRGDVCEREISAYRDGVRQTLAQQAMTIEELRDEIARMRRGPTGWSGCSK